MVQLGTKPLGISSALIAAGAIVAGGVLGGLLLANDSAASATAPVPHSTIKVTGNGEVTGTPNTLTIQLAVSTKAPSATASLDQNNAEMSNLEAVLTASGVKTADLQTTNLAISPNYDPSGTITSYGAEDDLTVTLRDLAQSGRIIDAAAHSVGNDVQIQGISYSISDTSSLMRSARLQAMKIAAVQASDLASGAGATLGPVMKIIDQEQTTTPPPREFFGASTGTAALKSAVPVQPGSERLSVQVDVVYELLR